MYSVPKEDNSKEKMFAVDNCQPKFSTHDYMRFLQHDSTVKKIESLRKSLVYDPSKMSPGHQKINSMNMSIMKEISKCEQVLSQYITMNQLDPEDQIKFEVTYDEFNSLPEHMDESFETQPHNQVLKLENRDQNISKKMDSEDYKNVATADTDFPELNDLELKRMKKHLEDTYKKPMFQGLPVSNKSENKIQNQVNSQQKKNLRSKSMHASGSFIGKGPINLNFGKMKKRAKSPPIKYTGKAYKRKTPLGWGSLLDIRYCPDFGNVEKVYRKMTKEDEKEMKAYIRWLEYSLILVDSSKPEEIPDIKVEISQRKKENMTKLHEHLDKVLDGQILLEFPDATPEQVQFVKDKFEKIYENLKKKIQQKKDKKKAKWSQKDFLCSLKQSQVDDKIKKYRDYFMAPENQLNLKTLIEIQERLSPQEIKTIYQLHNTATEEPIYGVKLLSYCQSLIGTGKLSTSAPKLIYIMSIDWPYEFSIE